MRTLAWGASSCPRCGHDPAYPEEEEDLLLRILMSLRRAIGVGARRRLCGHPLDLGWNCVCRSRFHGDFGLPRKAWPRRVPSPSRAAPDRPPRTPGDVPVQPARPAVDVMT